MTETATKTSAIDNSGPAFLMKGSNLTLTIFHLHEYDIKRIKTQLDDIVKKTPNFFNYTPIVIELGNIKKTRDDIDFGRLCTELREHSMIPIGVRGATKTLQKMAIEAGLAILPSSTSTETKSAQQTPPHPSSLIINQPVRSGQQVLADKGDLIIVGAVGRGSELLAHGNIHVYGPLRGRALAGINGNKQARIFCHQLDAELVSIAGQYQTNEHLPKLPDNKPIQIYLDNDKLRIASL